MGSHWFPGTSHIHHNINPIYSNRTVKVYRQYSNKEVMTLLITFIYIFILVIRDGLEYSNHFRVLGYLYTCMYVYYME